MREREREIRRERERERENDVVATTLAHVVVDTDAPSYRVNPFVAAYVAVVVASCALAPKPHGKRSSARSSYLFLQ